MPKKIQVPKTKKQIARPKKEWIEFGWGLGRMRDASFARNDKDIKVAAQLLGELIAEKAEIVNLSDHPYQSYWYMLQECKKILADFEQKMLDDLFNLGVSVPEIFSWDRMYKAPAKPQKKTTGKKK